MSRFLTSLEVQSHGIDSEYALEVFNLSENELLQVRNDGAVTIGGATVLGSSVLTVAGDVSATGAWSTYNSSPADYININNAGGTAQISIGYSAVGGTIQANSLPLLLNPSGNHVAINMATAPSAPLHIKNASNTGLKLFTTGGNEDRFHLFVGNGTGGFSNEEMYFECVNSTWHFGSGNRESFAIGIGNNGASGFARATFSAYGTSSAYFQQDHFVTEAGAAAEIALTAVHTVASPVATGELIAATFKSIVANTGTSKNIALKLNAANGANNYAMIVDAGTVGIEITEPKFLLHVNGRIAYGVPDSAPTDGDLSNGQITAYLDQTANELKFRVKYSDGTLKTGTVALT